MNKSVKLFLVRAILVGRVLKMVFFLEFSLKELGKLNKDLLPFLYSHEEV